MWLISMPVAAAQLVLLTAAEDGSLVGAEGFARALPLAASGPGEPFVTAAGVLGALTGSLAHCAARALHAAAATACSAARQRPCSLRCRADERVEGVLCCLPGRPLLPLGARAAAGPRERHAGEAHARACGGRAGGWVGGCKWRQDDWAACDV